MNGCKNAHYVNILQPGVILLAGANDIENRPMAPFEKDMIEFLDAVSQRIRQIPRNQMSDEMRSLGFWLRRSHLEEMKAKWGENNTIQRGKEKPDAFFRKGLGLLFHIAPSNVPLLFFYSCVIGLLAGNSCLVRLSDRRTVQDLELCKLVEKVLNEPQFYKIKNRISFVGYEKNKKEITRYFSSNCDSRIVWGGDETIQEIGRFPLKPSAVEVTFPDRTSMSVLDADAILYLSKEELRTLAIRFYNDTYSMDQNACSSPKIVFWRETTREKGELAAKRFWSMIAETAKRYPLLEAKVSRKYGQLWNLMGFGPDIRQLKRWDHRLYVAELLHIPAGGMELNQQFGFFYEYHMKEQSDWTKAVSERIQTLTYFGIDQQELWDIRIQNHLSGVSRIVPVGQALWMELNWDGKDMIRLLSR